MQHSNQSYTVLVFLLTELIQTASAHCRSAKVTSISEATSTGSPFR